MARLLIVDDDERIVELTGWFLERAGHRVRAASSYAAARELLAGERPELLLADLDLGSENGRQELPRLAAEGLLPPTLVVSGYLDPELERELRRLPGVRDTATKPVELDDLLARIERALAAGPEPAPAAITPAPEAAATEEDEDDGWVEIVPLAPEVPPAAARPAAEEGRP